MRIADKLLQLLQHLLKDSSNLKTGGITAQTNNHQYMYLLTQAMAENKRVTKISFVKGLNINIRELNSNCKETKDNKQILIFFNSYE